jgi:phage shock protein C
MYKKLYRSVTDKMVAGVCGGLAVYLTIDSTVVRILFVLIALFGGSGVLLYIVLWLVIPTQSSIGIIGEQTIKENTQDMEEVARKVVKDVGEKIDNVRTSSSNASQTKSNTSSTASAQPNTSSSSSQKKSTGSSASGKSKKKVACHLSLSRGLISNGRRARVWRAR